MTFIPTDLLDVLILEPHEYKDKRGLFMDSFNQRAFEKLWGSATTSLATIIRADVRG
jgi:dTDP-4-dehydrorhamnose 3,5-epimerase-like enzyme